MPQEKGLRFLVSLDIIGGPGRGRTYDQVIMSHLPPNRNSLQSNDLQRNENPVTPTVTPESRVDRKEALTDMLRSLDRETLLEALAVALAGSRKETS